MFNKHDKVLMWAFSTATGLLMIMYYMVFGNEMKTLLFVGISIIILEIFIFYLLQKISVKSFVVRNPLTRKKPIQNDHRNYKNRQKTHINKKQQNIKKATTNNKQSKQWTIIDISSQVDMTMQDVLLFTKNSSSLSFNNLNHLTKINNNKALTLIEELKRYKKEITQEKIKQVVLHKKKKQQKTITKPISLGELAKLLHMSSNELIQFARKLKMPFKHNIKSTSLIQPAQAMGLFNKIKKVI